MVIGAVGVTLPHLPQPSGLSSARERRRRNRQELSPGGRIVLHSRSNERLPQSQPPPPVEEAGLKDRGPADSQAAVQEERQEEQEEEEEVICLLDTTLHLAEPRRKSRDTAAPQAREAFTSASVRLRERSKSLRESVHSFSTHTPPPHTIYITMCVCMCVQFAGCCAWGRTAPASNDSTTHLRA